MEIKKATIKDAVKISRLRRKTLKEINRKDYPPAPLQFLINENSKQGIINKMKDRDIFCI